MLQRFNAIEVTAFGLVFLEFEIYPRRVSKPADYFESQLYVLFASVVLICVGVLQAVASQAICKMMCACTNCQCATGTPAFCQLHHWPGKLRGSKGHGLWHTNIVWCEIQG